MNLQQKRLFETISEGREAQILQEFISFYLDKGLGGVSKQNLDVFMFYLLQKYQASSGQKWTNYTWSNLLKISETKVKNLRLQAGISYTTDEENHDFYLWVEFLELIADGNVRGDGDDYVITVENPFLLRFLEHHLKIMAQPTTDYSFNREIVKVKKKSLELLVTTAGKAIDVQETYAITKIKNMKLSSYLKQSTDALKDLVIKALPGALVKLLIP